jgi:2-polyprenyl-6-methoxyphenol hydroxylase-like FAD-dependent oxidoreductase
MLLARKGYRVLVVDSAKFASDTISTHLLHPPAVASLERWGLAGRMKASGCPPIHKYVYDFGPFTIAGAPADDPEIVSYCPRRTVLDPLLIDAAAEAGAEVRECFSVDELLTENGCVTGIRGRSNGATHVETARVVIGADGRHSRVAETVRPEQYNERPPVQVSYYAYFSDLPTEGFETYVRPHRGWAVMPTNDGLTVLIGGRPVAEFDEYKKDVEKNLLESFELAPAFAARVRKAKRETRFVGTSVAGWFRKPFGPGWALVGDSGYNKDFIPGMGILDAFRDAELCANALHATFSGAENFETALGRYQHTRDEQALPMYEFTNEIAPLEPPPPEFAQLLAAISTDGRSMDEFVQMTSGMLSAAEFFSERNVRRLLGRAAPPAQCG